MSTEPLFAPIRRRLIPTASTALVIVWCASLSAPAVAQTTCDWYAKTALEQQKVNEDRKCGFKGQSWSSDRSAHMSWCREVTPERWKQQAQQREQQLEKCLAK